jgi:hypothetical protein
MRYDGEKLMEAGPRDGPRVAALGQFRQSSIGGVVPRRLFTVGVHEQVRVNGDHPPRPSYAMSRIRSHGAAATPD